MSEWEELVGADFAEHGIRRKSIGVSRAISALGCENSGIDYQGVPIVGDNPCEWYSVLLLLTLLAYVLPKSEDRLNILILHVVSQLFF